MPLLVSSRSVVLEALECSGTLVGVLDGSVASGSGFPLIDLNAPFERFCGDERARLLGRPFRSLACADAETLPEIEAAMHRHAAYRGSLRCRDAAGRERRLGLHLIPNNEPADAGRSYVLVGRDITEEYRQSEDSRAVQRLLLRSFMVTDHPQAILLDDRIVLANQRLGTLLGSVPDALIGRSLLEFVPAPFRSAVAEGCARVAHPLAVPDIPAAIGSAPGEAAPAALRFVRLDDRERSRHAVVTVLPPDRGLAPTHGAPPIAPRVTAPVAARAPVPGPFYDAGTMKEAGSFVRLARDRHGAFGLDPHAQVAVLRTLRDTSPSLVLADVGMAASDTRSGAELYLEAIINLPEALRRRLIPIFGVTASTSLPVTTIQRITQCCAGLGLRVDAVGLPPFNMSAWRPSILAIEAEQCDGPRLGSFTSLLHSYRTKLLVCGVSDAKGAATLAGRGVDLLTLA